MISRKVKKNSPQLSRAIFLISLSLFSLPKALLRLSTAILRRFEDTKKSVSPNTELMTFIIRKGTAPAIVIIM